MGSKQEQEGAGQLGEKGAAQGQLWEDRRGSPHTGVTGVDERKGQRRGGQR